MDAHGFVVYAQRNRTLSILLFSFKNGLKKVIKVLEIQDFYNIQRHQTPHEYNYLSELYFQELRKLKRISGLSNPQIPCRRTPFIVRTTFRLPTLTSLNLHHLQKSVCIWEKYHMSVRMANCKTRPTLKFEISDIVSTDTELLPIIRIISRKSLQRMQNGVGIEIDSNVAWMNYRLLK